MEAARPVPVVGMLDIPLAAPVLHWDGLHGVMVFGLAIATLVIAVFTVQTLAGIVRGKLRDLS